MDALINGLQQSIRFSMRTYCGAKKDDTLHNLARYAIFLFNLQEGSSTSRITAQFESCSWWGPGKNNNQEWHPTAMMLIANQRIISSSLSSDKVPMKFLSHTERRSCTPKKTMTPQQHLISIALRVRARQQYAIRYPASSGYWCLCLDAGQSSENRPVVRLKLLIFLLQEREFNKTTTFGQSSNTQSKSRPYYRGAANPTAYYLQPSVQQHRNRSPPTPGHQ